MSVYFEIWGQRSFFCSRGLAENERGRAFTVRATRLWNNLPVVIQSAEPMIFFKSLLKTYLDWRAFPDFIGILNLVLLGHIKTGLETNPQAAANDAPSRTFREEIKDACPCFCGFTASSLNSHSVIPYRL